MTFYVPFYGERPISAKKNARRKDYPDTYSGRRLACVVCGGRPCLRVVGKAGYCQQHVTEAFAAANVVMKGT